MAHSALTNGSKQHQNKVGVADSRSVGEGQVEMNSVNVDKSSRVMGKRVLAEGNKSLGSQKPKSLLKSVVLRQHRKCQKSLYLVKYKSVRSVQQVLTMTHTEPDDLTTLLQESLQNDIKWKISPIIEELRLVTANVGSGVGVGQSSGGGDHDASTTLDESLPDEQRYLVKRAVVMKSLKPALSEVNRHLRVLMKECLNESKLRTDEEKPTQAFVQKHFDLVTATAKLLTVSCTMISDMTLMSIDAAMSFGSDSSKMSIDLNQSKVSSESIIMTSAKPSPTGPTVDEEPTGTGHDDITKN